jgi:hypothetical protein
MEWLTNLELLAIIVLLLQMRLVDEPEPEPPPAPDPLPLSVPAAPTPTKIKVLQQTPHAELLICSLPAGHPDLQTYRDTPGYFLQHPDGTIEAGVQ